MPPSYHTPGQTRAQWAKAKRIERARLAGVSEADRQERFSLAKSTLGEYSRWARSGIAKGPTRYRNGPMGLDHPRIMSMMAEWALEARGLKPK